MNANGAEPNDWDKHFRLMADIDLDNFPAEDSPVIGGLSVPFTGTFDGNTDTISHFTCNRSDADNLGLFGYVLGIDAEIRNLGLIDPNVCAGTGNQAGSLVGHLPDGTVRA